MSREMDSSRRSSPPSNNGGVKLVMVALCLMTAASLYVAMTGNFATAPPVEFRPPSNERDLESARLKLKEEMATMKEELAKVTKEELAKMKDELGKAKESEKRDKETYLEKEAELAKVKEELERLKEAKKTEERDKESAREKEAELARVKEELQKAKDAEKLDKEMDVLQGAELTKVKTALAKATESEKELANLKLQLEKAKENGGSGEADKNLRGTDERKKQGKKPMNILLLYGDDWRHDSLGSASGGFVKTPFLDNLATEGIRFTHNCVTTSVCWISRATLYSGQYVSRHKSIEPMKPAFYEGWNQTFPHLLRENGYYYGHVGKWHFKDYDTFVKPRFDWERMYYGHHWFNERDGPIHTTKKNEKDAIEFLQQRPKDKPFFLSVCFFTPHAEDGNPEQYLPQNESMALYANDTVPTAPSATDEAWKKMPHFFGDINEGRNRFFWRFNTPERYQSMMKNYYRLISEIDSSSGEFLVLSVVLCLLVHNSANHVFNILVPLAGAIVKELERQGLLDDTLIIFTTDNGYFHAEHGLADKWYPYQESVRVPLIIRDPRMPAERVGELNDEFTLSIDLAPTILGAAGIETPKVMHGRDIAALYTEASDMSPWRKEFFYEHPVHLRQDIIPASEALVRKDYKYMLWPDYHYEQFFDLKNDTYELNDLINSTRHKDLIREMRLRFLALKEIAK